MVEILFCITKDHGRFMKTDGSNISTNKENNPNHPSHYGPLLTPTGSSGAQQEQNTKDIKKKKKGTFHISNGKNKQALTRRKIQKQLICSAIIKS